MGKINLMLQADIGRWARHEIIGSSAAIESSRKTSGADQMQSHSYWEKENSVVVEEEVSVTGTRIVF